MATMRSDDETPVTIDELEQGLIKEIMTCDRDDLAKRDRLSQRVDLLAALKRAVIASKRNIEELKRLEASKTQS